MPTLKKEQEQAINHDSGNIIVSASAGSGKTFVMIERAIRLICENKTHVKEILAVTFTEAAASEMKEKLKKALTDRVINGEKKFASEIADIGTADICTLHSFCGRLIRSYFFVAGIAPDFKVIDETEMAEFKKDAIDKTFKEFYQGKEDWFLSLVDKYKCNRRDDEFKNIILSLYDFANAEKDPDSLISASINLYTKENYLRIKTQYKDMLIRELIPIKNDIVYAMHNLKVLDIKQGVEFADRLYDDITVIERIDIFRLKGFEGYKPKYSFPKKIDEEVLRLKNLLVSSRDKMGDIINRYCASLGEEETEESLEKLRTHSENLFKVLNKFRENYSNLKASENVLDFDDLEHNAIKVLSDENIRAEVQKKYKYVFVDEYQDVNGVQEDIVSKVSNNNLFMVGDVKQSIYGFRGCNPNIFLNKIKTMEQNGETAVNLNHNFRSSNAVINSVNEIFSYSMTESVYGESYKDTSMLLPGGIYDGGGDGRFELHFLKKAKEAKEKEEPHIYDILDEIKKKKTQSDLDISSLVANIISGELDSEYYSPKEKRYKNITFSDIVILTRNMKSAYVQRLARGLAQKNIPISSEVSQKICEYPEVILLINVLKLVRCFIDDIAFASVIKSKIGGFTDEDLAEIALFYKDNVKENRGGFYDAFMYFLNNGDSELKQKVKSFYDYFENIRFLADYLGAGGVLEKVIRDSNYEEFLLCSMDGDVKVKRVKRFLSLSNKGDKQLTVLEFLQSIEVGGKEFKMSECGGENNVRIMTIHASKGLEFPVVIVCGLEKKLNSDDEKKAILADRELGFVPKAFDDEKRITRETIFRGLFKERIRENRIKEELRLFYVATTRASYSLHLTFEGTSDKRSDTFIEASKLFDYVPKSINMTTWEKGDIGLLERFREPRQVIFSQSDEKIAKKMQENFAYFYPHLSDCRLPLKTAVTTILKQDDFNTQKVENKSEQEHVKIENAIENKGMTDEKRGIIAHKIMQNFDFDKIADFDQQIDKMLKNDILTKEELSEINIDRIKRAIHSGVFDRLKGFTIYREKSFVAQKKASELYDTESNENVVLQGVIDLLGVSDDSIAVIDYKYSRQRKEKLIAHYKKQLDIYASVAASILNKKIAFKTLVNLFTGETIEID